MCEIENIQRRATRFICRGTADLSYKERLIELNLLPLNYWLEYLDILFYFKYKLGLIDLHRTDFFEFCNSRTCHGTTGLHL